MLVLLIRHWRTIAQIGAGAILGAFLMFAWAQAVIAPNARQEGRELERAAIAVAGQKAEFERKGDDAKLRQMSDFDLCVAHLRGRGLPIDACESLRGV